MHYSYEQWSDFARSVSQDAVAMERHLSSRCAKCNRVASTFARVAKVASMVERAVPDAVVHNARAIFAMHALAARRITARLIFDSLGEALPAGMRSYGITCRHAIFQADNIFIDVRLECDRFGGHSLVGQVTDRANPTAPCDALSLSFASDKCERGLALNRFGEFQTTFADLQHLRLQISSGEKTIDVPLYQLEARFTSIGNA